MIMTTTITAATTTTTTTIFIVSLTAMAGLFGCVSSTKVELCNRETQTLNCGGNDVIYIDSARSGRMNKGRCFANITVTCSADVTSYLEHKCAGRRQCSVSIDHTLDNSPHGCHPDLKTHLEIVYSCIPVVSPRTKCNDSPYVIHPTEPSGYLARVVTTETSIGSSSCPWVIEVKSGQTLALTLLDFGIWRLANQSSNERMMCHIYLTVTVSSGSPMRVCGGTKPEERERKSFVTSVTNSVRITVNSPGDDQFLVKYEVVGCPDLSPIPPHSSIDRHGDQLTIRCEAGRGGGFDSIVLTCVDGNWTGPALVNCSTLLPPLKGPSPEGQSSSFGGVLMVVVVAAAVVVVILVATVAIVVLWRQRILKRRSEEAAGVTMPLAENYQFVATPGCFDPAAFPGSHYALTPATAPTLPGGGGPIRLLHDGSRRPSAELLQRLDYSTLQSRRAHPGALPKNLGHSVSFSSFRQLPGTAAAAGDGPYNGVNAMMVYCPYHGTITRVHGGHPHHLHDPRGLPGGPGDCAPGHHPLSHSHEDVMGRGGGGGYDDDRGGDDGGGDQFLQQGIYQELDPQMISPDPRC